MNRKLLMLMMLLLSASMLVAQDRPADTQNAPNTPDKVEDKAREAGREVKEETGQAAREAGRETGAGDQERTDVIDRMNDSAEVLQQLTKTPDQGIPEWVLTKAKCVAIVPNMIKGGFVFGARHGRGVVTCREGGNWSAPAFFTVTGGSWGAQIGGQSVDLVMMIMNEDGMRKLLANKVELGGDVSVAAGPVGRDASAKTSANMQAQILTYSRSKGLYAGATLNGAYIRPDEDSTRSFYGRDLQFRQLLLGATPAPPQAQQFLSSVRETMAESRATR